MINNEVKDRYVEVVNALGEESLTSSFKEFILTFDGTNEKQFHLFVANFISLLISYKKLKIKSKGYDEFIESAELAELQIESIKKRFEQLSKGELPDIPVTLSQDDKE